MTSTPPEWRLAARLHGLLWLVGGLWPLLSLRTFMAVTGRKREGWLVRSVALLMLPASVALLRAARRGEVDPGIALAAGGGAAGLALVDAAPWGPTVNTSRVYALDGIAHTALAGMWAWGALRRAGRA